MKKLDFMTVWKYGQKIGKLPEFPGEERKTECPFCGGRAFVPTTSGGGRFFCFNCETGGGTIKFAKLLCDTEDTKEMFSEIENVLGSDFTVEYVPRKHEEKENSSCKPEEANIFNKSLVKTVREFAKAPALSEENPFGDVVMPMKGLTLASYMDLKRRGFTDEDIKQRGFISAIETEQEAKWLANKLVEKGVQVEGRPGGYLLKDGTPSLLPQELQKRRVAFHKTFKEDGNLYNWNYVHYMIPVYDIHANLIYFQIAWDKSLCGTVGKRDLAKYTTYSTKRYKGGAASTANAGWAGDFIKGEDGKWWPDLCGRDSVFVTEGTLKAPLFYSLLKQCNLPLEGGFSVTGVNNLRPLEKDLRELKNHYPELKSVNEMFDMDKFENKNVLNACVKIRRICHDLGLEYHMVIWNPELKGCDDMMLAYRDEKTQLGDIRDIEQFEKYKKVAQKISG